jgi:hypothetical protein
MCLQRSPIYSHYIRKQDSKIPHFGNITHRICLCSFSFSGRSFPASIADFAVKYLQYVYSLSALYSNVTDGEPQERPSSLNEY